MAVRVQFGRRQLPIGLPTLQEVTDLRDQARGAAETAAADAVAAAQPGIAATATTAAQEAAAQAAPAAADAIRAQVATDADRAESAAGQAIATAGNKLDRVEGVSITKGNPAFSVSDESGMTAFEVGETGTTRMAAAEAAHASLGAADVGDTRFREAPPGWSFALRDEEGNVAAGLSDDGIWRVREMASTVPVGSAPVEPPIPAPAIIENRITDYLYGAMHRGFNASAPENTLPAYVAAAASGFYVVECDVQWTADGEAVLLHDATVDRTSNGTGAIVDMTLAEAKALDFGVKKGAQYAGTQIPTFREFMLLCKRLNLFAYCELKSSNWTTAQVATVLQIISEAGMRGNVELDCFTQSALQLVTAADPTQQVGRLGTLSSALIASCVALQTGQNKVAACVSHASATEPLVREANAAGVAVVVWTVDDPALVPPLARLGLRGIMTNRLNINALVRAAEGIN